MEDRNTDKWRRQEDIFCAGFPSRVPGIEKFEGPLVHPQFWPEDLDYVGKKTVIIGSGATAVTILPAMHEDQSICVTPNGDFIQALHSGKADIVTGHIETVTSKGIQLKSGQFLDVDITITATGLKVQMCGSATLAIAGKEIRIGDKFIWRGSMLQDVPNLAFFMGYTNASWTLGSDATARLFIRLLTDVEKKGATSVTPTVSDPGRMKPVEMLNLSSNWVQAGGKRKQFPMGGDVAPWKPWWNYFVDSWFASFGSLTKGLVFNRMSS